jgi:tRNA threonylcarbamoyladenosine biosynthesis protein TsaE
METMNLISNSEEETIAFGREFASKLRPGNIVSFRGDLGAGKTEFIKGICEYFEVDQVVTSPTFTIINTYYTLDLDEIIHIDLYRLESEKELIEIGFDEILNDEYTIKLIEWSEKASVLEKNSDYLVEITHDSTIENRREISISRL